MQIYCRLEVVVHDPEAVIGAAVQQLRDAEIDWSAEDDDLETAVDELRADLLDSLASIVAPDRMLADVPGVNPRGGRVWAELGPPADRFPATSAGPVTG